MKIILPLSFLVLLALTACSKKDSGGTTAETSKQCKDKVEANFKDTGLSHIKGCFLGCCAKSGKEKEECDKRCTLID
jgi:hypothetical protein